MLGGLNEQVAGELPEQLRSMGVVKLNCEVAEKLKVIEPVPLMTVPKVLSAIKEYARTPVPESATVWGLLGSLSTMLKVPVRAPVAVGVNVTLTVQVVSEGTLVPQLLVCAKSPVVVTLLMAKGPEPVLVRANVRNALVEPTP